MITIVKNTESHNVYRDGKVVGKFAWGGYLFTVANVMSGHAATRKGAEAMAEYHATTGTTKKHMTLEEAQAEADAIQAPLDEIMIKFPFSKTESEALIKTEAKHKLDEHTRRVKIIRACIGRP